MTTKSPAPQKGKGRREAAERASETLPTPAAHRSVSSDQVARRAYEKWLSRGCPLGDELRDWLDAEQELHREANRIPESATS